MDLTLVVPAYREPTQRIIDSIKSLIEFSKNNNSIKQIIIAAGGEGTEFGEYTYSECTKAADSLDSNIQVIKVSKGKGNAMISIARLFSNDLLMFVDADLVGLTPEHVSEFVSLAISSENIRVRATIGGSKDTPLQVISQRLLGYNLTGQRTVLASDLIAIADIMGIDIEYSIETLINIYDRHKRYNIKRIIWEGVSQVDKLAKTESLLSVASNTFEMHKQILRDSAKFTKLLKSSKYYYD
jgi:glycosyltransferase involved in cell wall biosynthesis